jgi:SAM-dependent methyltransferase
MQAMRKPGGKRMNATDADQAMESFFSGAKLYGDDFDQAQIDAWFADEADGYFNLTQAPGAADYSYGYHALNRHHGYSALPKARITHLLGVGAAYGDELRPLLALCDRVTVLEPSSGFVNSVLDGVPVDYVKPAPSGDMPFAPASFDLITCLGVLHHIPNVSKMLAEFHRVLAPGGHVLVREPIISMGDWRKPRVGLTRRERGIPLPLMREFVKRAGFEVVRERKCMFSLTSRLKPVVGGAVFNNKWVVAIDAAVCALPVWSGAYHARSLIQKFRPTSVYYVLRKPT